MQAYAAALELLNPLRFISGLLLGMTNNALPKVERGITSI